MTIDMARESNNTVHYVYNHCPDDCTQTAQYITENLPTDQGTDRASLQPPSSSTKVHSRLTR